MTNLSPYFTKINPFFFQEMLKTILYFQALSPSIIKQAILKALLY